MTEFGSQPFDRGRHDRSRFDCGEPTLNRWLQQQASQAVRLRSAAVRVRCNDDAVVTGYFALAMTAVSPRDAPREMSMGALPIPAALIARLAVDRHMQGTGLGRELLLDAVHISLAASNLVAARMIVVDALDEAAAHFYRRHEFRDLTEITASRRLWMSTVQAKASL